MVNEYKIHMIDNVVLTFKYDGDPTDFLRELVKKNFYLNPNCKRLINTSDIVFVEWEEV